MVYKSKFKVYGDMVYKSKFKQITYSAKSENQDNEEKHTAYTRCPKKHGNSVTNSISSLL